MGCLRQSHIECFEIGNLYQKQSGDEGNTDMIY